MLLGKRPQCHRATLVLIPRKNSNLFLLQRPMGIYIFTVNNRGTEMHLIKNTFLGMLGFLNLKLKVHLMSNIRGILRLKKTTSRRKPFQSWKIQWISSMPDSGRNNENSQHTKWPQVKMSSWKGSFKGPDNIWDACQVNRIISQATNAVEKAAHASSNWGPWSLRQLWKEFQHHHHRQVSWR